MINLILHVIINTVGKNNCLPWNFSEDLKYFKDLTEFSDSIVKKLCYNGRKTWESIPNNF